MCALWAKSKSRALVASSTDIHHGSVPQNLEMRIISQLGSPGYHSDQYIFDMWSDRPLLQIPKYNIKPGTCKYYTCNHYHVYPVGVWTKNKARALMASSTAITHSSVPKISEMCMVSQLGSSGIQSDH